MKMLFRIVDERGKRNYEENIEFGTTKSVLTLGRDSSINDIGILAKAVSRSHGTFEMTSFNACVYIDHSRHGTMVYDATGIEVAHALNSAVLVGEGYRFRFGKTADVIIRFHSAAALFKPAPFYVGPQSMNPCLASSPKALKLELIKPPPSPGAPLKENLEIGNALVLKKNMTMLSRSIDGSYSPVPRRKKHQKRGAGDRRRKHDNTMKVIHSRDKDTMDATDVLNHPFTQAFIQSELEEEAEGGSSLLHETLADARRNSCETAAEA